MNQFILILTASILFFILACNRKCPCYQARIYLNYIGFANEETDTIVLRRFKKGTNFQTLNDSALLTINNSGYYPHTDTMHIRTDVESQILRSSFDYELFLPAANKLTRISEINEEFTEDYCLSRNLNGCINPITYFKLDGQSISPDRDYPNVYIRR